MKVSYQRAGKRRAYKVVEVNVYLTDNSESHVCSDAYNHPKAWIRLTGAEACGVEATWQRHLATDGREPGRGWTIAEQPWTDCYAGSIELPHDAGRVELDYPGRGQREPEKRARAVAKAIYDAVRAARDEATWIDCDLQRTVEALRRAGVPVRAWLCDGHGGKKRIALPESTGAYPSSTLAGEAAEIDDEAAA